MNSASWLELSDATWGSRPQIFIIVPKKADSVGQIPEEEIGASSFVKLLNFVVFYCRLRKFQQKIHNNLPRI